MIRRLFGVLLLCVFPSAAWAGNITMQGAFAQGGLVTGVVWPGSDISLDGTPVKVSEDGFFVLGFGRDAKPEARLQVTFPDGSSEDVSLEIEQRKFDIQKIDGLPQRKVTPKPEDLARIRDDNAQIAKVRGINSDAPLFSSGFIWPLKGRISGVYGSQRILNGKPKSPHNGVDIAAKKGSVIVAPADGVVALTHQDMFYSGKTLMLDHGHGLSSVYIHMSEILVADGQKVLQGDPIGKVGMTGRATGPHLHWGVTLFKTHLDPALAAGEMDP